MHLILILLMALATATPSPSPADALFQGGDFDGAYAAYKAAIIADPDSANALTGMGTLELYRNQLVAAERHLQQAAKLEPGDRRINARLKTLSDRLPNGSFKVAMDRPEIDLAMVAVDPLPIVHLRVNGIEGTFFIDTGADTVDLSFDSAPKFHVAPHKEGSGIFAGGKTADVFAGHIDDISAPGIRIANVDANIIPQPMNIDGRVVDGAIGTVFLSHFLSTIDYRAKQLVLRDRSQSAAFEASEVGRGAAIVPMWLVGDHFIFIRGSVGNAEGLYNLDTGGAGIGLQLTKASLDAAHITPDSTKASSFRGGGGSVTVFPFSAPEVSVGSVTRRDVPGAYFPDGDQYGIFPFTVAGTISHEFFRPGSVTFDFDAMNVVVD